MCRNLNAQSSTCVSVSHSQTYVVCPYYHLSYYHHPMTHRTSQQKGGLTQFLFISPLPATLEEQQLHTRGADNKKKSHRVTGRMVEEDEGRHAIPDWSLRK